jgi:hypothetical protein
MSGNERTPDRLSDADPIRPLPVGRVARLTFGGVISGGFLGSFAGALLGMAVGAFYNDVSEGLDGAVIGSLVAALAGGGYGILLALREYRISYKSNYPSFSPNPEQSGVHSGRH